MYAEVDFVIYPVCFVFSLYLGNPMDPPDVLGMDSNATKPTKLPNRAKSKQSLDIAELWSSVLLQIHHFLFHSAYLFSFLIFSASTVVSEHPPPRPPKPAVLLKSKSYFSSSKNHCMTKTVFLKFAQWLVPRTVLRLRAG